MSETFENGTITRRMDAVMTDLDERLKSICDISAFERKIELLKDAEGKSSRPSVLASLYDMFRKCGVEFEKDRETAYYEALVDKSKLPVLRDFEDDIVYALFSHYKEYPAPEEYMRRIVDRMSFKEDHWENDTLRLRILKQFIKYGNYLTDAEYGGRAAIQRYVAAKIQHQPSEDEVLLNIDDHVFDGLAEATKDDKKTSGKYGLIKLVDDLSDGKFRTAGATKRGLYLFAMVYGMSYYSGGSTEIRDYKSDIEKNLFTDYYANNLMRYLMDAYKNRLCEFEVDPSGRGINYKNFAEMIYIYFIASSHTPEDKIRLSSAMIKRVQDKQPNNNDVKKAGKKLGSGGYKMLFCEDILDKSEDEFEQFIRDNYNCSLVKSDTKKTVIVPMQAAAEQETAFKEYLNILENLRKLISKRDDAPENDVISKQIDSLASLNYGIWFTDIAAFKRHYESLCDRRPDEIDRGQFNEFMELMEAINDFLGHTAVEDDSEQNTAQEWSAPSIIKTKALYVTEPNAITRTSLIVAYYYYYNYRHEEDRAGRWESFEVLFKDFKSGIDSILDRANYQPLSGKNIFDVAVVLSSYAYLNS